MSLTKTFSPVWISTISHLDQHNAMQKSSSFIEKLICRIKCPDNFPHGIMFWGLAFFTKLPLAFCHYGLISIKNDELHFISLKPKLMGTLIKGINQSLKFSLSHDQIKSISIYRFPKPFSEIFNINWVRITTNEDILGGDFLMVLPPIYKSRKVTTGTAPLLDALHTFPNGLEKYRPEVNEQQLDNPELINDEGSKYISKLGYITLGIILVLFLMGQITSSTFYVKYKAENGNIQAQADLGWKYHYGLKVVPDYDQAVYWYRKAIEQDHAQSMNNLAWLFATCLDDSFRDGDEAIKLATSAIQAQGEKASNLDTLAAAFAETGRFDEAIKIQNKLLSIADINHSGYVIYQSHLVSYQNNKPWREN